MSLSKRSFSVWLPDNVNNSVCTVRVSRGLGLLNYFKGTALLFPC